MSSSRATKSAEDYKLLSSNERRPSTLSAPPSHSDPEELSSPLPEAALASTPDKLAEVVVKCKKYIDEDNRPALANLLITYDAVLFEGDQKDIFDHYLSKKPGDSYLILFVGYLGYLGIFAYSAWDLDTRLHAGTTLGLNQVANEVINYIITPFIAKANITYLVTTLRNRWLRARMFDAELSFLSVVKEHPFLVGTFAMFATGGALMPLAGKTPIGELGGFANYLSKPLIFFGGVSYYTMFNLSDTIIGFQNWKKSDSLLLKAFDPCNGEPFSERITALFAALHEFAALLERVIRMTYGAYKLNGLSEPLKLLLSLLVAMGTLVVTLGTRVQSVNQSYFSIAHTDESFLTAQENYEFQYSGTLGEIIKRELHLFFSSFLFLTNITVYFAYTNSDSIPCPSERISPAVWAPFCGVMAASLSHAVFRHPARKRYLIEQAQQIEEQKRQNDNEVADRYRPNKFARNYAWLCNFLDQASRVITFVAVLQELAPFVFNLESDKGRRAIFIEINLQSFIATAAFIYQLSKVVNMLAQSIPCVFAEKPSASGFFSRSRMNKSSDIELTIQPESPKLSK